MSRGNLLLAVFAAVFLMMSFGGEADGATDYSIHSMTVYLDSSVSSGYEYMVWDFGDGTAEDTRDGGRTDPVHRYAETGTYTIRQTVFSGDGQSDSTEHTVEVLGPPTVTFMCQGEVYDTFRMEDRPSREYPSLEEPEDGPGLDGMDFAGWVTQDGEPYDWDLPVERPLVLEASWTPSEDEEEDDDDDTDEEPEDDGDDTDDGDPRPHGGRSGLGIFPLAGVLSAIAVAAVLTAYVRKG